MLTITINFQENETEEVRSYQIHRSQNTMRGYKNIHFILVWNLMEEVTYQILG